MVSTTTYGSFPGVRVTTAGGAITGVAIGRVNKTVIIGLGDPADGSASVNDPTKVNSRLDPNRKFGDGTELAHYLQDALLNGANRQYLYGVMLDVLSITNESFSSTSTGTLANAPIIEDVSTITVTDTTAGVDASVEFRYDSPPPAPSSTDTVYINPITGEWAADASSSYDFDYDYPDWASALTAAETVIDQEDTGVIAPSTESEAIGANESSNVNDLRTNYKMATALSVAEPNGTSNDGTPSYDVSAYSTNIDNDAYYLHAPGRKQGSKELITGALAGKMSGNQLSDSIYGDTLDVEDLDRRLSSSDENTLRDKNIIPVVQPQSGGTITIRGNSSTSTATDWQRDYWYRRIVDQVILIARSIGNSILGRINDEETRNTVENQIRTELRGLANDRLIIPGEGDNWFVDVYEINAETVGVDLGVTPEGIAKRVDTSLTIST